MENNPLLNQVNQLLDARRVIEEFGFRTDKISSVGGVVKAPCFIHQDEKFATLIAFPGKNTCRCMMGNCPAHQERTLVELYALAKKMDPVSAALELAEKHNLPIDESLRGDILQVHIADALRHIESKSVQEATAALDLAKGINSDAPGVLEAEARLYLLNGQMDRAESPLARCIARLRTDGNTERALALVNELGGDDPGEELLRECVDLLLETGNSDEAVERLANRASRFLQQDASRDVITLLEDFGDLVANSARLRAVLGVSLVRSGERSSGVDNLRKSLEADDLSISERLLALECLVGLADVDEEYREQYALALVAGDRKTEGCTLLDVLAREALESERAEDAGSYLEKLAELDPEHIGGRETRAKLHRLRKEFIESARLHLGLAADCRELGLEDDGQAHIAQACEDSFEALKGSALDVEVIRLRLMYHSSPDNVGTSMAEVETTAREIKELGKAGTALAMLEPHRDSEALLLRAALHEAGGQKSEGIALLERSLLVQIRGEGDEDQTAVLCAALEHYGEDNPFALHAAALAELRAGNVDDGLTKLETAANGYAAREEHHAHEARTLALESLIQRRPDDMKAHLALLSAAFDSDDETLYASRLGDALTAMTSDEKRRALAGNAATGLLKADGKDEASSRLIRSCLSELAKASPNNSTVLMARFEMEQAAGDDNTEAIVEAGLAAANAMVDTEPLEATRIYEQVEARAPNRSDVAMGLATAREKLGDAKKAADALVELAHRLLKDGGTEHALPHLERAAGMAPDDPEVFTSIAQCKIELGDAAGAIDSLLNAAELHAKGAKLSDALGCLKKVDGLAPEPGRFALRIVSVAAHITSPEDGAERGVRFVRQLLDGGALKDAAKVSHAVANLTPESVMIQSQLIETLAGKHREAAADVACSATAHLLDAGNRTGARRLLQKGLELDPDNESLLRQGVRLAQLENKPNEAVTHLQKIAIACMERQSWAEAEDAWRSILELAPGQENAREGLARTLENKGEVGATEEAVELLVALADAADDSGDTERSVAYRTRVLAVDPDLTEARAALARGLLDLGRFSEARAHFIVLADHARANDDPALAIDYYEKVLETDAENTELLRSQVELTRGVGDTDKFTMYSLRLAGILGKHDQLAEAIRVCRGIVETDPGNNEARIVLAGYLARGGELEEAAHVIFDTASEYIAASDLQNARETLSRAERFEDLTGALQRRFGRLYLECGAETEGLHHLRLAVKAFESEGQNNLALEVIDELLKVLGRDAELMRHQAALLKRMGRKGEAVEALRDILRSSKPSRKNETTILEEILEIEPDHHDSRRRLAQRFADQGRRADAYREWTKFARSVIDDQPKDALDALVLARDLEDEYSRDFHELLIRAAQATDSSDLAREETLLLVQYLLGKKDYEEARTLLGPIVQDSPGDLAVRRLALQIALADGDSENAESEFLAIANEQAAKGDRQGAIETLRAGTTALGDSATLRQELFDQLVAHDPTSAETTEALFTLVRAQLESGEVDRAHDYFANAISMVPDTAEIHQRAGALFEEFGIPELAADEYVAVGHIRLSEKSFDEALALANRCVELRPRDVEANALRADVLEGMGDGEKAADAFFALGRIYVELDAHEKAVEALKASHRLKPGRVEVLDLLADQLDRTSRLDELNDILRELSAIQEEAGELDEAIRSLKRLVHVRPDDTRARLALIEACMRLGIDQDLVPAHLELAETYLKQSEPKLALDQIRKASEAAPQDDTIRERLIVMSLEHGPKDDAIAQTQRLVESYLRKDKFRLASAALERVREFAMGNPDFHLAQAQVHAGQNAKGRALEELNLALEAYGKAGRDEQRIPVLREILRIDPQDTAQHHELIAALVQQNETKQANEQRFALAGIFAERGFLDRAEKLYREVIESEPMREDAWMALFDSVRKRGDEAELIPDYLRHADVLLKSNSVEPALDEISKVIRLDSRHIEAREAYIKAYLLIGPEQDLCEDYLTLADIYIANDRVDEGVELFNRVMTLDPQNNTARERLTETQARMKGKKVPMRPLKDLPTERPHETWRARHGDPAFQEPDPENASTQGYGRPHAPSQGGGVSKLLANALGAIESEDETASLELVARNYRDILSVNPQNANVRIKLADISQQMGDKEEMVAQLRLASESLFQKGDLSTCITVCERILKVDPADQKVRLRLKQAFNKRDAFKALESAILFSDRVEQDSDKKGRKA